VDSICSADDTFLTYLNEVGKMEKETFSKFHKKNKESILTVNK